MASGQQRANGIAAVAFTYFAWLQINDPDPLPWIALYGTSAIVCAFAAFGRMHWAVPALLAIGALVWASMLAPEAMRDFPGFSALFRWDMKAGGEVLREIMGLLIVFAWSATLATTTSGPGHSSGSRGSPG
jgi:hypothetical protein